MSIFYDIIHFTFKLTEDISVIWIPAHASAMYDTLKADTVHKVDSWGSAHVQWVMKDKIYCISKVTEWKESSDLPSSDDETGDKESDEEEREADDRETTSKADREDDKVDTEYEDEESDPENRKEWASSMGPMDINEAVDEQPQVTNKGYTKTGWPLDLNQQLQQSKTQPIMCQNLVVLEEEGLITGKQRAAVPWVPHLY
ncbi:hypothetical protein DFS33DRAFT_1277300 [Desarmillaria ectypa]|nr:hypothetical protein DFS33DRAFT_1277300 [Desarmillaria ectypa]